jgi:hypothetical protein
MFLAALAVGIASSSGFAAERQLKQLSGAEVAPIEELLPEKATVNPRQPRKLLLFWRCEGFCHEDALAWIQQVGKGRVCYCSFGHEGRIFGAPRILQFYLDGIQYALGDLEADATPSAKLDPQPPPALPPEKKCTSQVVGLQTRPPQTTDLQPGVPLCVRTGAKRTDRQDQAGRGGRRRTAAIVQLARRGDTASEGATEHRRNRCGRTGWAACSRIWRVKTSSPFATSTG